MVYTPIAKGKYTINIYACPDGVIDTNAALIASRPLSLNLAPDGKKAAKVLMGGPNVTALAPLPGSYTLLAQLVDSSDNMIEENPESIDPDTGKTITPVTMPVSQLNTSVALESVSPTSIVNDIGHLTFYLLNDGNVNVKGAATLTLGYTKDTTADAVTLDTETIHLSLRPGSPKERRFTVRIVVGNAPTGTYYPVIGLTQGNYTLLPTLGVNTPVKNLTIS
jgi:hypothetical protein